jgi:hypothetical protein
MIIRALVFLVPTVAAAAAGYYFAIDPMMGALVGGFAGAILGIALNAFPNLDQKNEEEDTGLPLIDP